jgi:O-antigen ligase
VDAAWIGLIAAFLFGVGLAFDPGLQVQFTLPKLVVFYIGGAAILLTWAWRVQRGLVRPVPRLVLVPALALAAWWLATFPFAADRHTALYGMHGRYNGLIAHASMLVLFLAIASSGLSRDSIRRLTAWMVAALIPVAGYAAAQSAGWELFAWPNIRPGSTIGHPVPLAAILSMALPVALAGLLTAPRLRTRVLAGAAALLLLLAVAGTLSRGPWVGLAAGLIVMLMLVLRGRVAVGLRSIRWYLLAVCAVAAVVAFSAVPMNRVVQRISMFRNLADDPSFADRFVMYRAAIGMIRDHPIAGVGLENFGLLYPRYRPIEPEVLPADTIPTMVHNGYLETATTTGIPGLVVYLLLIAAVIRVVWRDRPAPLASDSLMPMAFLAAITSYLVQDLSGWLELSLSAFFWSVAGAAVAFATAQRDARPVSPSGGRRWLAIGAALAAVTATAAAGSHAFTELQADRLFHDSYGLDVAVEWPQIDARIQDGLNLVANDPYYVDSAGILVMRRFHEAPSRALYDRAAALFERARAANRFDPYILVNRIELDTEALTNKTIASSDAGEGERAARAALDLDPNNASVYRAVASFELAGGQSAQALAAIETARRLRPHQPQSYVVEGDVRRALSDRAAAAEAYRRAADLFARGGAEWINAERRLVVTLAEMGRYADAVQEGRRLLELAPNDELSKKLLDAVEASAR